MNRGEQRGRSGSDKRSQKSAYIKRTVILYLPEALNPTDSACIPLENRFSGCKGEDS